MNDEKSSIERTCKMIKKSRIFSAALAFVVVHLFGPLPISWAQSPQKTVGEPVEQLQKTPIAPTAPVITPDRMQVIAAHACTTTNDIDIGSRVSAPLGLSAPGEPFPTKQAVYITLHPEIRHIFAVHKGDSTKVLVFTLNPATRSLRLWTCDMNGNLLVAGAIDGGRFNLVPLEEARPGFEAEMRLWAERDLNAPASPTPTSKP